MWVDVEYVLCLLAMRGVIAGRWDASPGDDETSSLCVLEMDGAVDPALRDLLDSGVDPRCGDVLAAILGVRGGRVRALAAVALR